MRPPQVSHRARPAPHSIAQSTGTPLGFKSPVWCLMSAFVTTLGVFNLDCFLWCLCLLSSLFYLLARSLSLAALAWGVSQTFQPQLPPLRLAGSRVMGPHPLPADPRGARMSQVSVLPSQTYSARQKWVWRKVRGKSAASEKDVSSRSTEWGCHRRGHAASRPAHIQTHLPEGILTLDDKALFVNMLLICNFENKIETSCILKYKMKCDALYTI